MKEKSFIADTTYLDEVYDFAHDELLASKVGKKLLYQIDVIIEELFTNVANYAYGKKKGNMVLGIDVTDDMLTLVFKDAGVKFDPLAKDDPDITLGASERRIGGLGIFMVKKFADDVTYKYEHKQNILTVTKKLEFGMENVAYNLNGDLMTLKLSGRIDSSNASIVQESCLGILHSNSYKTLVLDLDKLDYISSAGLRVILHLLKENPTLSAINVSSEVYEIFEMTGFSEMFKITKAYRKLSIDGCEVVGEGANGKVYRLDSDTIVKLYFNPESLADIHRERELARKALILGIPTAIPYDVVKIDDKYGSVFELLEAKSLAKLFKEHVDYDKHIKDYVELLKIIHSKETKPEDMPSMKDVVLNKYIPYLEGHIDEAHYAKLKELVAAIPEDNHVLHGDYHLKNVMLQKDEVLLIDMDTLSRGNKVFEFGFMYNAYIGFYLNRTEDGVSFQGPLISELKQIYFDSLKLYFADKSEAELEDVNRKAALIGCVRLLRRTLKREDMSLEENKVLVNKLKETIYECLDHVDSLAL